MAIKNERIVKFIIVFCITVIYTLSLQGQEIIERPSPPKLVNDFVGLLSANETQALETKLVTYANETSTQIAVVIISSLEGYEVSQYGAELALKWGIGTKNKDNGLLILVSKAERKMTIQTGYGLEEKIPDITASRLIRNVIAPAFKKGQYYQGLDACTTKIISILKGEFVNENKTTKTKGKQSKPMSSIIWILIVAFIIISLFRRGSGGGLWFLPFFMFGGGGGYYSRDGYSDFGGGGSSFGGFGGGDFGGGGASGDW